MYPKTINRQHKDRLFRLLFQEKEELLSLYNAINGTNYTDIDALTVNTLDNSIYMGMKNDISFLVYGILNLYEHQSTWNPNMPLRDLIYIVDLIKGYIEENEMDVYGSKLIRIPTPQAIVFYNGTAEQPERQMLKLSDSYQSKEKKGCLEFECLVLNINYGKNKDLLEKCKQLMDYSILIDRIRCHEKKLKNLELAVEKAIDECIEEGILEKILRAQRGVVKDMILQEYDEQKHIENEKRWSYEDGREAGKKIGEKRVNTLTKYLIQANRTEDLLRCITDEEYQEQLFREFGI